MLNTDGAAHTNLGFLCVPYEETKTGTTLLALVDQCLVPPNATLE